MAELLIAALEKELPRATAAVGPMPILDRISYVAWGLMGAAWTTALGAVVLGAVDARVRGAVLLVQTLGILLYLGAATLVVLQMAVRLLQIRAISLDLLDENWRAEQVLIGKLRAYPVALLSSLARRLKLEAQLLDRRGAMMNILSGLSGAVMAIYLALAAPVGLSKSATPASAPQKPEAAAPLELRLGLAMLAFIASMGGLYLGPSGARMLRMEYLVNEACIGEREGVPTLDTPPPKVPLWRQAWTWLRGR